MQRNKDLSEQIQISWSFDLRIILKVEISLSCRIRLTDENGIQGEWSEYATFEMGLLEKSDWKATFIMGDYDHEKNRK